MTPAELYDRYRNEWRYVDQVQTCVLESADDTGHSQIDDVKAKSQLAIVHSASEGQTFETQDTTVTWVLWADTLQGYHPDQSDVLTDEAGQKWTLGPTIRKQRYGTQFVCDAKLYASAGGP